MTKIEQQIEALATAVAKGFDAVHDQIEGLEAKVDRGFREVRLDIHGLQEISIPLPEQDELWKQISRIEQHLGLSPELG